MTLKTGCFFAIEVNDFWLDGKFYIYHADTLRLLQLVGFEIWEIIIADYGAGFLRCFATEMDRLKRVSKQHSYILVARKGNIATPRFATIKDYTGGLDNSLNNHEEKNRLPGF